jgi:hypothetical protein
MHPIAKDFVLGCLRLNEKERLQTGETDVFGANVVRSHPWFNGIDWDDVEAKAFLPEWRPIETLQGRMDLRCVVFMCSTCTLHGITSRISNIYNIFRYACDVDDAPFADEYVVTGAAVAGSKKDAFVDF